MPFALIFVGLLLVTTGARNRLGDLRALVVGDFTGEANFFYWLAAIGIIGGVGYYTPAREFSRLFLALIVLAMLLSDKGVFANLQAAVQGSGAPAPASEADVGAASADRVAGVSSSSGDANGASLPRQIGGALNTIDQMTQIPTTGYLPGAQGVHDFLRSFGLTFDGNGTPGGAQ